jgi:hypothetical protein
MYNRLIPFLVENKIITDAQNGFRRKKSTNTSCQTLLKIYRRHWIKDFMP